MERLDPPPVVWPTVRLGRLLEIELVNLHRRKWLDRDERPHVPVQMVPAGQLHVQPVDAALPLLDLQLRAEAMFQTGDEK
jgi:hypothetical protein